MWTRAVLVLGRVVLSWWFTLHILSGDGMLRISVESNKLYDSEAACETARKATAQAITHLHVVLNVELPRCESQDRTPR